MSATRRRTSSIPSANSQTTISGQTLDAGRNDYYGHSLARVRRPGLRLAHTPAPAAPLRDDSDDGNAYRRRSARLADVVRVRPVVHARPRPGPRRHARGRAARWSAFRSLAGRVHGQRPLRRDARRGARRARPSSAGRRSGSRPPSAARARSRARPAGSRAPAAARRPSGPTSSVRLRAAASPGFRFAGWTGSCRGTGPCVVKLSRDRSVRATFRRK